MKSRYFISLFFSLIFLVSINLLSGMGFSFLVFFDLASVLIMIIFPSAFMLVLNGWKNIRSAFYIFCKKNTDKKELLNAKIIFENYSKILFSMAFIGFIITFVSMMYNLEVKEELGPRLATASISLLYAGIINMVIIIPYKIIINRKIEEIEN